MRTTAEIEVEGARDETADRVLTPEALEFVAALHEEFEPRRRALLEAREERKARIAAGELPTFPEETTDVRAGDWRIPPAPADLEDRRVEITGPVDRKMMINALNSGAKVFMADFEDSLTPSWQNVISGQVNVADAVAGTIALTTPDKDYRLGEEIATLVVRPRGWHLPERHLLIGGEPVAASLFDFGLFFCHNAKPLLERGSGPYLYLPKLDEAIADAIRRGRYAEGPFHYNWIGRVVVRSMEPPARFMILIARGESMTRRARDIMKM